MKKRFQIKVFLMMIATATFLSVIVAILYIDFVRGNVETEKQHQLDVIEKVVTDSLTTIDKVYYHYESDMGMKMKSYTEQLQQLYTSDPTFRSWDFEQLAEEFGMNVYVLDKENTIIHSNDDIDLGLDFNICCSDLVSLFDERRESGAFYLDSFDVSKITGDMMRYSYMATPDKEYLLELGVDLSQSRVHQVFNFLDTIENLKSKYPELNDVHILNHYGFAYGYKAKNWEFTGERRKAYEEVRETGEKVTYHKDIDGEPVEYHYVLFQSEYTVDGTQDRVIEIVYSTERLDSSFIENRNVLFGQLAVVFIIIVILTYLISRWTARPLHLAFHDGLTGLGNRTSFNERLTEELKGKKPFALIMFDLDNFKEVNDRYGHDEGDRVLKEVTKAVKQLVPKNGEVFRFGGDEFSIVFPYEDREQVTAFAKKVVEDISFPFYEDDSEIFRVTISIGISFNTANKNDVTSMYKEADIALYRAKQAGKHCYKVFESEDLKG